MNKKYVFKINGYEVDIKTVVESLNFEDDAYVLLNNGSIEVEDATSESSSDILTIEEVKQWLKQKKVAIFIQILLFIIVLVIGFSIGNKIGNNDNEIEQLQTEITSLESPGLIERIE